MLSDESSSDSETGRFKCQTKNEERQSKFSGDVRDRFKSSSSRSRPMENERFRREFDRKHHDKDRYPRPRSRDRQRHSRRSPARRKYSRSPKRRSPDRQKQERRSRERSRTKDRKSRDRGRHSRSRSHKSSEPRRDLKKEIIKTITPKVNTPEKKADEDKSSSSPDYRSKKSVILKPPAQEVEKRKSNSPIILEEYENKDENPEVVQPGSYYKMIPAVVQEKPEESSEIDSSDDEKLRAKLLNLEKELHKTRKKKHRKRHRQKSSKTKKDKDTDASSTVEVTSTTDIPNQNNMNEAGENLSGTPEVTSTQKSHQKDSSEEGEILSDESQSPMEIDPSDLRHKLKRHKELEQGVCGPALPPHLQTKFARSHSPKMEGPALPPTIETNPKNIGPSIPDDMREVLATRAREVIVYESSDEDVGIGPLPTGAEKKWSDAHKQLEERALEIKINKMQGHSKSDVKSREKWMLELPEGKTKYLGLEARSFRAKPGPDMSDRSSWTDTPEDKAKKAAGVPKPEDLDEELKKEAKAYHIAKRDEEQEIAVKKHKKKHKRDESLLETHQRKLKKKKKKEEKESGGKVERRPFSRDVDLQVNRFDEAQKKAIIKKAQHLDTRFSRGEAKYL